jgi:hypothetical protein
MSVNSAGITPAERSSARFSFTSTPKTILGYLWSVICGDVRGAPFATGLQYRCRSLSHSDRRRRYPQEQNALRLSPSQPQSTRHPDPCSDIRRCGSTFPREALRLQTTRAGLCAPHAKDSNGLALAHPQEFHNKVPRPSLSDKITRRPVLNGLQRG